MRTWFEILDHGDDPGRFTLIEATGRVVLANADGSVVMKRKCHDPYGVIGGLSREKGVRVVKPSHKDEIARAIYKHLGETIDKLPPPLNRTTDVQTCATAFADAFEKRSRRVYVPGWVGVLGRLRMLLTTAAGERLAGKDAAEGMARMDEQVLRLGRSVSERYTR